MLTYELTSVTGSRGGGVRLGAGSPSAIRRAILLMILGSGVTSVACQKNRHLEGSAQNDNKTTWSAEAQSPDGLWLATALSQQRGGPETALGTTSVYLKWIRGSQPPTQVLGFSHRYATMNLTMEWATSTRLNVTYGPSTPGDHVSLDFQAVKCGGIDISVRDVSSTKTVSSQ
jgi:hypothetical protein